MALLNRGQQWSLPNSVLCPAQVLNNGLPQEDMYILSEVHIWLSLQPHGTAVWIDDMFMGTAVLVEWAKLTGEVEHLEYAGGRSRG